MAKIKHGWCGTPLYNVWKTMRQRCRNINSTDYKWYGAVGIDICDEWEDFKEFRDWSLKNGYSIGLTIDRINPSAGYSPDNCRWITIQDQQKNKKSVLHINLEGDTFTVSEL